MSDRTAWTCPTHETVQQPGDYCQPCVAIFDALPDATTMDHEQRAAELQRWIDLAVLTVPWDRLQGRAEALVGRGVWTHEFAHPELLVQEILAQQPASFSDVLNKIPGGTQTVLVEEATP